ncbi:MAG: MMPL family transporter [Gammaproteobacteria bacterium]|nr:MAG: MMPL family transporter [Gammaproteobacteria bacterium]
MRKLAEQFIPAYARWIIRWRWLVVVGCLLAVAAAGYGLRNFAFTADYKVYFSKGNAELIAFEKFENTYTNTENILFVLQPKDKNVFTRETLEIVRQLTEKAWQIPYAIRVDSLTNYQHTEANGDDLTVTDLVQRPQVLDTAGLARIRAVALKEPSLVGRMIASDGTTTGISVTLQFPGTDHTGHLPESVAYAEKLTAELRADYPDLTVALTGISIFSAAEIQVSESDSYVLVPVMYGLMITLLLVLLRSVSGTVATLLIVSLSVVTALGLMSWLGIKMNASTALAPIIILTLAIADSVHILLTTFDEVRAGRSKHDALIESLNINTEPVFLTTLTTSIGFLSLNFSDSPPFNDLGNITAIGVVAAWIFAMTFLPALMSILPLRLRPQTSDRRLAMDRFGDFVVGRRVPLFWGMMALSLVIIAFIPRLELDDRFIEWFDESIPFRVDTDFATANLTGPYVLEYSIDSGEAGGISEPEYLKRLEAFTVWLRTQPEITHVNSFTDVMKRLNKSMHGDDPGWYRLPDKRELAAQYLLLYEMSLPYGLDLNSQIDLGKSATRLTVTLDTIPQKNIIEVIERSEAWLAENMPPAMQARATGTIVMFVNLAIRNIISMLGGTALAFVLISLTLVFALRSIRLGLISLIPNFLPVLITFGLWAIFVGEIGIIASMITATSMGLIVDDTVHILSKYHRAKSEHNLGTHDAIRYSFSHVGKALWVTTLIMIAGFSVLAFSSYKLNVDMGVLTTMAVGVALAMDFLLLPALLMFMDKDKLCNCATCREKSLATV